MSNLDCVKAYFLAIEAREDTSHFFTDRRRAARIPEPPRPERSNPAIWPRYATAAERGKRVVLRRALSRSPRASSRVTSSRSEVIWTATLAAVPLGQLPEEGRCARTSACF